MMLLICLTDVYTTLKIEKPSISLKMCTQTNYLITEINKMISSKLLHMDKCVFIIFEGFQYDYFLPVHTFLPWTGISLLGGTTALKIH